MVPDLADLAHLRQQLVEVTAPAGRVVAFAVTLHRRPIKDRFDAAAYSARAFWHLRPDGLHDPHNERDIDSADGEVAQDREHEIAQGLLPPGEVFLGAPAIAMGGYVLPG